MIKKTPPFLYHFTSAPALEGILRGKLWFTDTRFLNDDTEGLSWRTAVSPREGGASSLSGAEIESLVQENEETLVYVMCLTNKYDDMYHWRSYCKMGDGLSLEFDTNMLTSSMMVGPEGLGVPPTQVQYGNFSEWTFSELGQRLSLINDALGIADHAKEIKQALGSILQQIRSLGVLGEEHGAARGDEKLPIYELVEKLLRLANEVGVEPRVDNIAEINETLLSIREEILQGEEFASNVATENKGLIYSRFLHSHKDAAYEGECEYRYIVSDALVDCRESITHSYEGSLVKPRLEVLFDLNALKSITVGPTPNRDVAVLGLKDLLKRKPQTQHIKVKASACPYRPGF